MQRFEILKLEVLKKSATRTESNHTRAAQVNVPDDLITFKVLQTLTLYPFDSKKLSVPLWKDFDPVVNLVSA